MRQSHPIPKKKKKQLIKKKMLCKSIPVCWGLNYTKKVSTFPYWVIVIGLHWMQAWQLQTSQKLEPHCAPIKPHFGSCMELGRVVSRRSAVAVVYTGLVVHRSMAEIALICSNIIIDCIFQCFSHAAIRSINPPPLTHFIEKPTESAIPTAEGDRAQANVIKRWTLK